MRGVFELICDMCAFGLRVKGSYGKRSGEPEALAKKPTKLITNILVLAEALHKICDGKHEHAQLLGGPSAEAAKYSDQFVRLRGLTRHLRQKKLLEEPAVEAALVDGLDDLPDIMASTSYNLGAAAAASVEKYLKDEAELNEAVRSMENFLQTHFPQQTMPQAQFPQRNTLNVIEEDDAELEGVRVEEASMEGRRSISEKSSGPWLAEAEANGGQGKGAYGEPQG
jgi:hypothetical protein